MAENTPLGINVTLGTNAAEATRQVDQFSLALGRVDQQARRLFASLQGLSERYQREGFLGQGDQRTLERSLAQWERMSQVLEMRRRGAEALGQQGLLDRFTQRQAGLGVLESTLTNILGGRVPRSPLQAAQMAAGQPAWPFIAGRFSAWTPGMVNPALSGVTPAYLGRFSPWTPGMPAPLPPGALIGPAGTPLTYAGRFSPWTPGMRNPLLSGTTPTYAGRFSPWDHDDALLRQQQRHAALVRQGLAAPTTAGQIAWTQVQSQQAQLHAQEVAQNQAGLQQAQRLSIFAQLAAAQGESPWPGRFERAGNLVSGALGPVQRTARLGLGAAAGIGVYQTLTESMDLYRQRAQGIIAVGMQLDLNFARVGETIDSLRTKYQVLAHDSIAAQLAMVRVSGSTTGLEAAVRTGAAYGIAAPEAAGLAATLGRLTVGGAAPLRTVADLASLTRRGITPMGTEALLEETTRIAGVGGTGVVPVGIEQSARWMRLISNLGQRYNVPGAASQFYGEFVAGVNQSPDATTQAIRIRALRALAARQGPLLHIGPPGAEGEDVDLRTITGLRIAMEQSSQSPEILEQYRQTAREFAGGNPEAQELFFESLLAPGMGLTKSRRLRREVEQRGGFAGLGAPVTGEALRTQEQIEADRLQARHDQPYFQVQITQALKEAGLERMGEPLVNASNQLKQALINMTDMIREGTISLGGVQQTMQSLDSTTKTLLGAFGMLGAESMLGKGFGAVMFLEGMFGNRGAPSIDPAQPFESVPTRPGPSLLPQR